MYQRKIPLSDFPIMALGSSGIDGGFLMISKEEREHFISQNSASEKFIKPFISGGDFLNGIVRYCLWIENKQLKEAIKIPEIVKRIEKTEIHRLSSKDKGANKLAERSHQFRDFNIANDSAIIIPNVSSEARKYIPIGYVSNDVVLSNSASAIYHAKPWIFAVIASRMHMVWVRNVGGKLESRYRYSAKLCYNTFPFPTITSKQKENLSLYVFSILDERAKHPSKTMAQLYNPLTMPKGLLQAHQELDTAIEQCYRLQDFNNDTERLEYLFKQYEEMAKKDTLFAKQKKTRKKK
jgi:hypothetical protein